MERPQSIVTFERLYLASFVLWVIATAVFWSATVGLMEAKMAAASPQMMTIINPIMIGSTVLVAAITLLLWYLAARRANVVAKWFIVAFEAFGALSALLTIVKLASGNVPSVPQTVLGLVITGLAIAAAVMLFRPDAKAWFGEPSFEGDTRAEP